MAFEEPETIEQEERWRQIAVLNTLGQTTIDIRRSHENKGLPIPSVKEVKAAIRWGVEHASNEFLSNKEHRNQIFASLKFQEKMGWEEFNRLQEEQANGGAVQTSTIYDAQGNMKSRMIVRKDVSAALLKALNHILNVTRTIAQLRGIESMIETHDKLDEIEIIGDFGFYNTHADAPIVENDYQQIEDVRDARSTA